MKLALHSASIAALLAASVMRAPDTGGSPAAADDGPSYEERQADIRAQAIMDGRALVAAAVEPLRRQGSEVLNITADAIERACGAVLNHLINGTHPDDAAAAADEAALVQAKANIAHPEDGTILPDHVVADVQAAPSAEAAQAVVDDHLAAVSDGTYVAPKADVGSFQPSAETAVLTPADPLPPATVEALDGAETHDAAAQVVLDHYATTTPPVDLPPEVVQDIVDDPNSATDIVAQHLADAQAADEKAATDKATADASAEAARIADEKVAADKAKKG